MWGTYIVVCVHHKVKPEEIKETNPVCQLVPDTVKAQSHDGLHAFLVKKKRHASLMDQQTDRPTHCECGSHPVWGEGVLGGEVTLELVKVPHLIQRERNINTRAVSLL